MRKRVFTLAMSMSAAAAIGAVPTVQAAAPHSGQTPIPSCRQAPAAPPGSGAALAVTIGRGGSVTLIGQVASGMKAPLSYHFRFGDDGPDVTQASSLVQHTYGFNAEFFPTVTVTDATGVSATSAACGLWIDGVKDSVHRYAGDDRYLTSSAVSQKLWADAGGDPVGAIDDTRSRRPAKAVVLASGQGFADALAGVPLAAYKQGPLLLTEPNRLTKTTEREIERVLPAGATVYVLGGQAAISPTVDAQLHADGYHVTRYAGKDRYGTAMRIATAGLDNPASAIVVTGNDFADALAAGPAATGDWLSSGGKPAAIVLSDGSKITDPATAAFVKARVNSSPGPQRGSMVIHLLVLGGKAFCAVDTMYVDYSPLTCEPLPEEIDGGPVDIEVPGPASRFFTAVIGRDRFQTAAGIARTGFTEHSLPERGGISWQDNPRLFGIASGTTYADALTGGAAMAVQHDPILLTARDFFPADTAGYISLVTVSSAPGTFEADIFGGPAAIAPALQNALIAKIHP